MSLSLSKLLALILIFSSCSQPETKHWNIPLQSSEASLKIELPIELNSIKRSVHFSDCESCGKYQTFLAESEIIDQIEDTSGFFAPWPTDFKPTSIFCIEEQRQPGSYLNRKPYDLKVEFESLMDHLKSEYLGVKIRNQLLSKNKGLIQYETYAENGSIGSKRIECLIVVDDRIIRIYCIQNRDFLNELIKYVWKGLLEMNLEVKK